MLHAVTINGVLGLTSNVMTPSIAPDFAEQTLAAVRSALLVFAENPDATIDDCFANVDFEQKSETWKSQMQIENPMVIKVLFSLF